jgi:hypothetical protein
MPDPDATAGEDDGAEGMESITDLPLNRLLQHPKLRTAAERVADDVDTEHEPYAAFGNAP